MNKFKFLSCAVMAAFFAMGITSCEKENFAPNVDIEAPEVIIPDIPTPETWKPGDAVLAIQPTVIAVINGEIKDVTSDAKVTFNGEEKLSYTVVDGAIAKFDVEIAAAYYVEAEDTTLTATKTINVPALTAGQVMSITPTLVLSANFEEKPGTSDPEGEKVSLGFITEEVEGSRVVTKKAYEVEFDNTTNYYWTNLSKTVTLDMKYGTEISNTKVAEGYEKNTEVQAILGSFNQIEESYKVTINGINLWPTTKTCIPFEQICESKNYVIKEKFETRATTETTAATFTVTDYSYIISTTPNYYNSGTGHTGHGHAHSHGHGHGHGADNAGGGIVNAL